jgi:hypothetical protein
MHDTRDRAAGVFGEGVFRETIILKLFCIGDTLEPYGVPGVANKAQVVGVDPNVEELVKPLSELLVEPEAIDEVSPAVYALPEQFLPEFHGWERSFLSAK